MARIIRSILDLPMQLGECPLWDHRESALYWIDISGMAVHRFCFDQKTHRAWSLPSEPGCIALHSKGGLVVAMRSGIAHLDTVTGSLDFFLSAPFDTTTMRFNDGRCDASGRLWVGAIFEPRTHAGAPLYRVEHGTITDTKIRATVSNGVAFSPDGQTLYHADTTAHEISAYDVTPRTGIIRSHRVFKQFDSDRTIDSYGGRPDGAAVDSTGAYWCAMFEGGRVMRLSPQGDILQEISLPVRCPTMIAFGGTDLRTLFITSARQNRSIEEVKKYPLSGHVLAIDIDVAGLAEFEYRP